MRAAPRPLAPWLLSALLACLFASLCACGRSACAPARKPNVLLITVDTLRADHLGCYGYGRPTSPELDAFAREAVLYEQAYSQAPFTAPAHASLFTGLHSQSHGVLYWGDKLDAGARSYPERFGPAGWRTAAFYNHIGMSTCNLQRGFDHVKERAFEPAQDTFDDFLAWVDGAQDEPFAAWVHLWDVHRPYGWRDWNELPPVFRSRVTRSDMTLPYEEQRFGPPWDVRVGRGEQFYNLSETRRVRPFQVGEEMRALESRDFAHLSDRYDGGVWFADQALGRLFAELKRRGLWENTLIVITSDHGETLTERKPCWYTHDPYLYEEVLRVPLIVRLPGGEAAGTRVRGLARGIDVLPTLLEVADLPAGGVQGRSLLPLARGVADPGPVYLWAQTQTLAAKESERKLEIHPKEEPGVVRLSEGRLRLVHDEAGGSWRLYDLGNDEGQTRDLSAEPARKADLERMRAVLESGWVERRETISDGRWKLLWDREYDKERSALFDLLQDPGEQRNLMNDSEAQVHLRRLQAVLQGLHELPAAGRTNRGLDESAQALLKSAGYAGETSLEPDKPK